MFEADVAGAYDAWFDTPLGRFVDETETECAFRLLEPGPSQRILDIGCGTGHFTEKIAATGAEVVGVDASQAMLEVARGRLDRAGASDLVRYRRMDAHALEFEDNSFDGVLSMATISFVEDPAKVLQEMLRVTKDGGRVVIGALHRDSSWGEFYQELARQGDPVFRHAKLMSRGEIEALDPARLVTVDGCLYLPPDTDEAEISREEERRRGEHERPGFLCALWTAGAGRPAGA